VVGEIHGPGEVFDTDGDSLGLANCDLRPWPTTRKATLPDGTLLLAGTIIPYVGGRASVSSGVSARFIGVRLTCRLADGRTIHFQWFDNDGHVYRATISPDSE
jgi:hypothetical protein